MVAINTIQGATDAIVIIFNRRPLTTLRLNQFGEREICGKGKSLVNTGGAALQAPPDIGQVRPKSVDKPLTDDVIDIDQLHTHRIRGNRPAYNGGRPTKQRGLHHADT